MALKVISKIESKARGERNTGYYYIRVITAIEPYTHVLVELSYDGVNLGIIWTTDIGSKKRVVKFPKQYHIS